MEIISHADAQSFLETNQSFLEVNEAANNLILGLALSLLKKTPDPDQLYPVMLTIYAENQWIGCTLQTSARNIVIEGDPAFGKRYAASIFQYYAEQQVPIPGIVGPAELAGIFVKTWSDIANLTSRSALKMRVHQLEKVTDIPYAPGTLRKATLEDLDLVGEWVYAFGQVVMHATSKEESKEAARKKIIDQEMYLWENDNIVSMAATARPSRNGIVVNHVYTPPEFRKKGYATSCVASLSELMLQKGNTFCTLFTDLNNPTSNKIYREIGYKPICDFASYSFL